MKASKSSPATLTAPKHRRTRSSPAQESPAALPVAHPLDEFYAQLNLPLPQLEAVDGGQVPEPYKSLLVHQHDMTPTLAQFYQDKIHLQVLRRQHRANYYFRQVLLLLDRSQLPIEFGATKVNLSLFSPAARRDILEERIPLGQILEEHQIRHSSRPKAFLRILSDPFINGILQLPGPRALYGRRNTLLDSKQRPLAEIFEILPPAGIC